MVARLVLLFIAGALLFSVFDGFHTHSGTTAYPHPVLLGMAWWTPFLFGSAVAGGGAIYALGYRRLNGPPRVASWSRLALCFTGFGLLYFATGFWAAASLLKLAAVLAGASVLWLLTDRSWQGGVLCLVSAVGGTTVEMTLVGVDAFRYLEPDVLGVPFWLPALYIAAGPAIGQLARRALAPSVDAPPRVATARRAGR